MKLEIEKVSVQEQALSMVLHRKVLVCGSHAFFFAPRALDYSVMLFLIPSGLLELLSG